MGFTNNITVCIRLCFFSVEPPNKQIKARFFATKTKRFYMVGKKTEGKNT